MNSPATARKQVGLIGLGLMGKAFARRLIQAGWQVTGFDVAAASRRDAGQLGVRLVRGSATVFRQCDRVVLSLPTLRETEQVLRESGAALCAGHLILDTTTGEPGQAETIHEHLAAQGVRYLDATVSGNSEQVAAGDDVLTMVGADLKAFAAARPVLRVLTRKVVHVGPCGSGARMKLVTNLVLGLNRAALAEGLCFAEALGFSRQVALDVLLASQAYSAIMTTKGSKMVAEDFTPQARLSQHLKDVRIMLAEAAGRRLDLPLTRAHRALLEAAEAAGLGSLDNSALIKVFGRKTPPD